LTTEVIPLWPFGLFPRIFPVSAHSPRFPWFAASGGPPHRGLPISFGKVMIVTAFPLSQMTSLMVFLPTIRQFCSGRFIFPLAHCFPSTKHIVAQQLADSVSSYLSTMVSPLSPASRSTNLSSLLRHLRILVFHVVTRNVRTLLCPPSSRGWAPIIRAPVTHAAAIPLFFASSCLLGTYCVPLYRTRQLCPISFPTCLLYFLLQRRPTR